MSQITSPRFWLNRPLEEEAQIRFDSNAADQLTTFNRFTE